MICWPRLGRKGFDNKKITSAQGLAKPYVFAIPWTYVPVASKLGLRPQTVSPRPTHFVSWNDANAHYVLLQPFPPQPLRTLFSEIGGETLSHASFSVEMHCLPVISTALASNKILPLYIKRYCGLNPVTMRVYVTRLVVFTTSLLESRIYRCFFLAQPFFLCYNI